jgi:site-specific DNA-methyltransferase (adenine-specific)
MNPRFRNQILVGDAATTLPDIPDGSVDTVLTSPPYFRLRDYGTDGQVGLERHVDEWVGALRAVSRELARVLVPTGTLWLNLGDTYSTHLRQGTGRKGLLLGPERLALALMADGWLIRNKVVWAKTNHLPTSATDRLACGYEVVYLLTRSTRYFFDLDSIRVPHRSRPPKPKPPYPRPPTSREPWRGPNGDDTSGLAAMKASGRIGHPLGKNPGDVWPMSVSSYRGEHHAAFPAKLVRRVLEAGCPEACCVNCRSPYVRPVRRFRSTSVRGSLSPTCRCGAPSATGLVLDPFMGSGTTAVVAEDLGRDWLGIELNPIFARQAQKRVAIERRRRTTVDQLTRKEVA